MTFKTLLLTSALLASPTPALAQAVRPTPVGPTALEGVIPSGRGPMSGRHEPESARSMQGRTVG